MLRRNRWFKRSVQVKLGGTAVLVYWHGGLLAPSRAVTRFTDNTSRVYSLPLANVSVSRGLSA